MDAENTSGQSIIEFLLLVPMLLGFVIVLIKTNILIQSGIVNQQFLRLQTHFISFNSPYGVDVTFKNGNLANRNTELFTLGIQDNASDPGDEDFEGQPKPTVLSVARSPAAEVRSGASDDGTVDSMDSRVRVRVRQSVAVCLHPFLAGDGTPLLAATTSTGNTGTSTWAVAAPNAIWKLNETYRPSFCRPDNQTVDP